MSLNVLDKQESGVDTNPEADVVVLRIYSRQPMRFWVPFIIYLLVGLGLLGAGCTNERVTMPAATTTSVALETTSTTAPPPSTTTPPDTVARPTARILGLPLAPDSNSDTEDIMVMQRLLSATCCKESVNGTWGPSTESSIQQLRQTFGLPSGGLDRDLWGKIFAEIEFGEPAPKSGFPSPISVPSNAVQLHSVDGASAGWWTIAANTSIDEVQRWFDPVVYQQSLGSWQWCDERNAETTRTYRWWRGEQGLKFDTVFELRITDYYFGRVDIHTSKAYSNINHCLGYVPITPPTTVYRATVTPQEPASPPAFPQPTVTSVERRRIGAICRDGWRSYATGQGACSWHGGVARWLYSG